MMNFLYVIRGKFCKILKNEKIIQFLHIYLISSEFPIFISFIHKINNYENIF